MPIAQNALYTLCGYHLVVLGYHKPTPNYTFVINNLADFVTTTRRDAAWYYQPDDVANVDSLCSFVYPTLFNRVVFRFDVFSLCLHLN